MIEGIRKILSSDNIKEMACKYTGAEEEYQGFILGCNVLSDEIEEIVKNCSIPNVSQQHELLIAYEKHHYTPSEWALASKQCEKEIDDFLATNCG